jgi:uncharacterized membrane protein YkoI
MWPEQPPATEDIAMLDKQMKPANWRSGPLARLRATLTTATVLAVVGFALAGGAVAGEINDEPRWKRPQDYSSLKDWHLKGENIVPHGVNPLYYPIVPGHKHAHERSDHPDGKYRKETVVLNDTEDFDLPGIGKFKTAVVQEEEYIDEVLTQRALNWFAVDKTTNSVYVFGEVSWEINEEGKPIFAGTWRAGEPDGDGTTAEPGLLMPGTFTIGGRYLFDGSRSMAYGGAENMEAGIEITVPAGTFKNCVRVREQGLLDFKDITDKIWCPVVGVVLDTSDGKLVVSSALPKDNPASDVSSIGSLRDKPLKYTPPVAKISGAEATKVALELIPGRVTSLTIERKRGKNVYVVEIRTPDGGEKDVFVDIESGKIVGTD